MYVQSTAQEKIFAGGCYGAVRWECLLPGGLERWEVCHVRKLHTPHKLNISSGKE
jgi:hypothetical protein